jgi:hypothetical protein
MMLQIYINKQELYIYDGIGVGTSRLYFYEPIKI